MALETILRYAKELIEKDKRLLTREKLLATFNYKKIPDLSIQDLYEIVIYSETTIGKTPILDIK